MKDLRKRRLRELLDKRFKGDRAAFMKSAELTKGRVAQLLDKDEPFGDVAAQRLQEKLGLPKGYFDNPQDPETLAGAPSAASLRLTEQEIKLVLTFRNIPEDLHDEVLSDMLGMMSHAKNVYEKEFRERFGVVGTADAESVNKNLKPAPAHSPPPSKGTASTQSQSHRKKKDKA